MSHLSQISVVVKDLICLGKAASELGGKLNRDAKTFVYYGNPQTNCDHNVSFPDCSYQVGVIKDQEAKETAYNLQFDPFYSGGLGVKIGNSGGLLKQKYTEQVTRKAALMKNYTVKEQKNLVDEKSGRTKTRLEIYLP
jgi:hypothetical protein